MIITSGLKKILIFAASVCVFVLLAGRLGNAAEEVRILWLTDSTRSASVDRRLLARIQDEAGVRIKLQVTRVQAGRTEELFVAIERARRSNVDLVFGLTRQQVMALAKLGLRAVSESQLGKSTFRNLQVFGNEPSGRAPVVLGIPIEMSLPVVCMRRDFSRLKRRENLTIELIAYGKVADRISIADPRVDSVGRSVFLSAFLEGKGTHDGWTILSALDRFVEVYPRYHWETCEAVSNKRADIGFTTLGLGRDLRKKWPEIDFIALDRAMLVPVFFAAALDHGKSMKSKEAMKVLRWLSEQGAVRVARKIAEAASRRGLKININEILSYAAQLKYFPVSKIVNDWSTRYGFKSRFRETE